MTFFLLGNISVVYFEPCRKSYHKSRAYVQSDYENKLVPFGKSYPLYTGTPRVCTYQFTYGQRNGEKIQKRKSPRSVSSSCYNQLKIHHYARGRLFQYKYKRRGRARIKNNINDDKDKNEKKKNYSNNENGKRILWQRRIVNLFVHNRIFIFIYLYGCRAACGIRFTFRTRFYGPSTLDAGATGPPR